MIQRYRIVRHDQGRIISRSPVYWPDMPSHAVAANIAATRRDALERRIQATLQRKTLPMVRTFSTASHTLTDTTQPSSLAKRMDEACATDLSELKRATFPEEPTLTAEPTATTSTIASMTTRSRATRFQPAFAKPADNTTIPAEPTATVTSSTIPSYYTHFQPATSTKSADNTTATTSKVSSSTIPSHNTRFQPATTKSADNTTSTVGPSTTHSLTTSSVGLSTRSTRPFRFQQVPKPAENTTVTTTTSSESRSSYSVSH